MLQRIEGKVMEVVDLDEMPQLPITGLTESEATYQRMVGTPYLSLGSLAPQGRTVAKALTNAIETGIITEPGKYGVHWCGPGSLSYEIYKIDEES
jgi:hypothetical protein